MNLFKWKMIMSEHDQLRAVLADLRTLVEQARAHGNSYPAENLRSHYWYGVAAAYGDAAARLEALLDESEQQVSS
nr:hypothetical protein [uncultured bacterium]